MRNPWLSGARPDATWTQLGVIDSLVGDHEHALLHDGEALRLSPTYVTFANVAGDLRLMNRLDEAEQTVQTAFSRNFDGLSFHTELHKIAFLRGDRTGMQRQVEWTRDRRAEAVFLEIRAAVAEYSGRIHEAERLIDRASTLNTRDGLNEATATLRASHSNALAITGDAARATALADSVVAIPATWTWCLQTYAMASDQRRVERLLARFKAAPPGAHQLDPLNPIDIAPLLAWLKGMLLLNRDKPEEALRAMQAARAYQWTDRFLVLPQYWRAYALLAAHRPSDAATEFQTLIVRRSISPYAIARALAHVGLARAYAASGDRAASRKAYEEFFALWKDADADLPILVAARKEYGALAGDP